MPNTDTELTDEQSRIVEAFPEVDPDEIPPSDKDLNLQHLYNKARQMNAERRNEIGGKKGISNTLETLANEAAFGTRFQFPFDLTFSTEYSSLSEIRMTTDVGPNYGEDTHRAFRSFEITAGKYRRKALEMLEEYQELRRRKKEQEKSKKRIQRRKDEVARTLKEMVVSHPMVDEQTKKRYEDKEKAESIIGINTEEGWLSRLKVHQRGRGVNLKITGLPPELAAIVISVVAQEREETLGLLSAAKSYIDEHRPPDERKKLLEDLDHFLGLPHDEHSGR